LSADGITPTWDRRLQAAFDPKKLAVGRCSLVTHQAQDKLSRFLRVVTTGLFNPADPFPIRLSFRSHPFSFRANRSPHFRFHIAWVKNIRGHAGPFELGGEVSSELIESYFARSVGAVERARGVERGG
jgi:hypothetical protein